MQALPRVPTRTGDRGGFDAEAFAQMVQVDRQLHEIMRTTVLKLVDDGGFSWGEIGRACGMTRQRGGVNR